MVATDVAGRGLDIYQISSMLSIMIFRQGLSMIFTIIGFFGMSINVFSLFVLVSLAGGEVSSILGKVFATLYVFGVAGGYSFSFGPLVWLIFIRTLSEYHSRNGVGGECDMLIRCRLSSFVHFLDGARCGTIRSICNLLLLDLAFDWICISLKTRHSRESS